MGCMESVPVENKQTEELYKSSYIPPEYISSNHNPSKPIFFYVTSYYPSSMNSYFPISDNSYSNSFPPSVLVLPSAPN